MTRAPVVVAYDGSPHSILALQWAVDSAALGKQPVSVVMVTHATAGREHSVDGVRARVERELHDVSDVTLDVRTGAVLPVLLDIAERAALMVVGSRGHGQVAGALTGSVSQHLARHAACPVVVVRHAAQPSPSRIVVGVDGSGGSAQALEFACSRAEVTGEPVAAVHGWRLDNIPVDKHGDIPSALVGRMMDRERLLVESVADLTARHPDVELRTESIPVVAALALTDASQTASLLVVGSRGRGAFPALLLGSVSQHVMLHAQCPVAIVR